VRFHVRRIEIHVGRLYRQPTTAGHRVARIDGEVHDHLLELAGIDAHRTRISGKCATELNVLSEDPGEQPLYAGDCHIEVHDFWLEHLLAAEREQLPRELAGALRSLADLSDVLPRGRPLRRFSSSKSL